ncbi:protein-glutamate O-methyltransferase CheR [Sphingomonas changnyeongensis]|uniref:Protein-glutamate O-methyltransferase CheR n=1 Tax=Sphingomonas changnyeongensis TaxID=2698679 RepID=A0A7Z2S679_9SPHN|nr:protein-glutamate O-methyltransferase CheR [Sphingomonas changnyeongensis]
MAYLASLLEQRTGQQIGPNRLWRIETVLKAMIRAQGIASLGDLVARLRAGAEPALVDAVLSALLNHETYFFRDTAAFKLIETGVLDQLREARGADRRIAIWSAGCSTGQEAYSLAMIFANDPARWQGWTVDIQASDVSAAAVERARTGSYSQFEIQRGLPITSMLRWFDQDGETWRVGRALAGRVRFKRHHLLDDPAPGRFDLILCRNVMLYFNAERRRRAFDRLADALAPDGYLMLGAGETVIGQTDRFGSDPELRGLYRPAALIRRQAA